MQLHFTGASIIAIALYCKHRSKGKKDTMLPSKDGHLLQMRCHWFFDGSWWLLWKNCIVFKSHSNVKNSVLLLAMHPKKVAIAKHPKKFLLQCNVASNSIFIAIGCRIDRLQLQWAWKDLVLQWDSKKTMLQLQKWTLLQLQWTTKIKVNIAIELHQVQ